MKRRHQTRRYKGYVLEITAYGVDLVEPWHPNKYYALYKVSLKEAIRHIRYNPPPDLETLGWAIIVCLDDRNGLI